MKLVLFQFLALFSITAAFAPQNFLASRVVNFAQTTKTTFAASTLDTTDENAEVTNTSPEETLALQLQVQEMEEVRMELVAKYVSAGKSQEYAQQEVDKFLSDPERSEQFLDMRRYAKAQANELMGFESTLVIFGAFFLGLSGNVLFKYLSAYKDLHPDGNGPIPFL